MAGLLRPRTPAPEQPPPPPPLDEVRKDVVLAMALAGHGRATGDAVDALRDRLAAAVTALEPEAAAYTAHPDRAAHRTTLRQAVDVAGTAARASGDDPVHRLRLLAKAADTTMRLAAGHRHPGRRTPC